MQIINDPADFPKSYGKRGFVPSLGNLHRGHLSLVSAAQEVSDEVVVSIFVNPTQFRVGEDYDRYPRTPEIDLALCEAAGVTYAFMPSREGMYPAGDNAVTIHVGEVGDLWEGAIRPHHFDGVATVVANLFLAVRPDRAIFGQKDLQQNAVIRRLLGGLKLGVTLQIEPTIRETDGLALSSRNSYLSAEERHLAPQLYGALCSARDELMNNSATNSDSVLTATAARLDSSFTLQYFALVNRNSMQLTSPEDKDSSLIIAAVLGGTRLIDNVPLYT
jgi:pantoate--beta-alanine ligase